MAKVEIINIRGNKEKCVNLSGSVGLGGINEKGDLTLIQALFYYLYFDEKHKTSAFPAPPIIKNFPVTGFMEMRTIQMIAFFQSTHRQHLLNVDGRIHPASYENRVIKDTNKPLMTITYLHILAKRKELIAGHSYIKSIVAIMKLFQVLELTNLALQRH